MANRKEDIKPVASSNEEAVLLDKLRLEMLSSLEKYTRAMFKAQNKRTFVVNEHHRKIFEALQDVVDGKCTRLIINMPPRYSKCLHPSTRVLTERGLIPIGEVRRGDRVWSFKNGRAVLSTAQGTEPARKPSVKVTMRSGRSFVCSTDHPMLTTFGYVRADKLKPGDRIQALCANIDSSYEIDDAELLFATMMIFEGNCSNPKNLRFTTSDKEVFDIIQVSCEILGIGIKHYPSSRPYDYHVMGGLSGKAYEILERLGLSGHSALTKRLPTDWFSLSARQKYMFLDLMFATDGWVNSQTGQCGIDLANEGLTYDIQQMLATVGIVSSISYRDNGHAGVWNLVIPREYGIKLLDRISFYHKRPSAMTMLSKKPISLTDTFPFEIIRREKLTYKARAAGMRCEATKDISRAKMEKLSEKFPQLSKYLCEDFYLDRVEKIEDVGVQDLVHLGVDDTHNFIANGLVSHNTEVVIKQFISWCFALNPTCMFLHLSYSDTLVNDNSSTIRQIMSEPLYKMLFPNSALEREKGATNKWKTKAGGELYAVSTQGQVTGFGAGKVDEPDSEIGDDIPFSDDEHLNQMLHAMEVNSNIFQGAMLIDDPLKPEDALSDTVRERINQRFENTLRNRVNSRNTPIIIIMQRLHEHDLCGYLMETEPDKWRVLSLPAILSDEDGNEKALWPLKHNIQELHDLRDADPIVFETQYMQNPTPKEGLMYDRGFSEYTPEELGAYKPNERKACNYTDTADTGADSLCSICFIDTPEFIYVTDVLYTTDPMEKTEPQTARMLDYNGTVEARIESNNGGRGFARKVQSLLKLTHKNFKCVVHWFHQSQNKYVRIYNNSATAMAIVKFPKGWERRWPKFHSALMSYRKENNKKNAHDDAPDCLTGCVEMKLQGTRKKKIRLKNG